MSWLEEAVLLTREENRVQVFPSSLRVGSMSEAQSKLQQRNITVEYRRQLLRIFETLMEADPDEGISTDELMEASGLDSEGVRRALYDLEAVGIASRRYGAHRICPRWGGAFLIEKIRAGGGHGGGAHRPDAGSGSRHGARWFLDAPSPARQPATKGRRAQLCPAGAAPENRAEHCRRRAGRGRQRRQPVDP